MKKINLEFMINRLIGFKEYPKLEKGGEISMTFSQEYFTYNKNT